tara:strand:+ start:10975 stop:11844 length:870 start_codon:yes stop_codon:yes gene_type:complete
MNFVSICAKTIEAPRVSYTSETQTVIRCNLSIPPVGDKAPTFCEYNVYGQRQEQFRSLVTQPNQRIFIHGAKIRHDLKANAYSLHGGVVTLITEDFPLFNTVILGGRCIKDINPSDEKQFKVTASGLMIANQTLSVNTGRSQADLFNFYAINKQQDRLRNAELICNFTRKGVGLTINGKLTTDAWKDASGNERTNTKIQLASMTLGPKPNSMGASPAPAQPLPQQQTPVENNQPVNPLQQPTPSLWSPAPTQSNQSGYNAPSFMGGNGLPDLPGQYGDAPVPGSEDVPF